MKRSVLVVAIFCVGVLAVACAAAALTQRANSATWRQRAVNAEQAAAQAKADADSAAGLNTRTEQQNKTLNERIDTLANEKAKNQDDVASAGVQRDAYKRIADGYADVTASWRGCVDGYGKLDDALTNPAKYVAADIERFKRDLEALCSSAKTRDEELRKQLQR